MKRLKISSFFKIILLIIIPFLLLFLKTSTPAFALTCGTTPCNRAVSTCECNGASICATQGSYCSGSPSTCQYGWKGGSNCSSLSSCPVGSVCNPGGATKVCTANLKQCSGGCKYQVCAGDGSAWGGVQDCPANSGCVSGGVNGATCQSSAASQCTTTGGGACTANQRQCSGGCKYQICAGDGSAWGGVQDCPANSGCVSGGTTGATCQSSAASQCSVPTGGTCPPNQKQCLSGCNYQICAGDGSKWGDTQSCPPTSGCVGGGPNGASCQTSAALDCESAGELCSSPNGCAAPQVCKAEHGTIQKGICTQSTPTSPVVCCQFPDGDPIKSANKNCPVCADPYLYDASSGKCVWYKDSSTDTYPTKDPDNEVCAIGQLCAVGCGCNKTCHGAGFLNGSLPCGTSGSSCSTAIGSIGTDPTTLVKAIYTAVLSIAGGIALLLIMLSGYRMTTSQGNPEALQNAREQLTAAIVGLLFIILSFTILRFIGVDLLGLF